MAYWLTRDEKDDADYDFWDATPRREKWGWRDSTNAELLFYVCQEEFEMLFIARLKPGEIRKVKSINIELEE